MIPPIVDERHTPTFLPGKHPRVEAGADPRTRKTIRTFAKKKWAFVSYTKVDSFLSRSDKVYGLFLHTVYSLTLQIEQKQKQKVKKFINWWFNVNERDTCMMRIQSKYEPGIFTSPKRSSHISMNMQSFCRVSIYEHYRKRPKTLWNNTIAGARRLQPSVGIFVVKTSEIKTFDVMIPNERIQFNRVHRSPPFSIVSHKRHRFEITLKTSVWGHNLALVTWNENRNNYNYYERNLAWTFSRTTLSPKVELRFVRKATSPQP